MATKQRNLRHPWGSWLTAQMEIAGVNNAELSRRSDGEITEGAISYWRSGAHSAAPDKAIRVARLLNADIAGGLRAAGHDAIADLVAELMAGRPTQRAPSDSDPVAEAIIDGVQRIVGNKRLTATDQRDALAHLERRVNSAIAEVEAAVGAILASRNEADSA